jgi:4,5-dihydroxyphthalate decarboxylase
MRLKITFWENPRLQPLLDGTVQPEGVELDWELGHPSTLHQQHLLQNDADVFENGTSTLLAMHERPEYAERHWVGLPVFLTRAIFQLRFEVRDQAGIRTPADLRGKRFGIPDYEMAAAIWLRVILRHVYGVPAEDITWVTAQRPGRGAPPAGTESLRRWPHVQPGGSQSLSDLLQRGEVDAAFYIDTGALGSPGGRGTHQLLTEAEIVAALAALYQQTGAMPINHTVLMQASLLAEHPWLAGTLVDAFERSKQEAYRRSRRAAEGYLLVPEDAFARQIAAFGDDPYPSGLAANRRSLAVLQEQLVLDGLVRQPRDLAALFADPSAAPVSRVRT